MIPFHKTLVCSQNPSADLRFLFPSAAEIALGLFCTNFVVLPRLYQQFCDLTPYTITSNSHAVNGKTEAERAKQQSHGRSKREWIQLEGKAAQDQKVFGDRARLGDEEAMDIALDEDSVKK